MLAIFPFATEYNDTQEKAVIAAAQKGSRAAIETLIKEYQPFVYKIALKLVKYKLELISDMALSNGFKSIGNLMDSKRGFVDACWEVVV
jgi:hypothetical protein